MSVREHVCMSGCVWVLVGARARARACVPAGVSACLRACACRCGRVCVLERVRVPVFARLRKQSLEFPNVHACGRGLSMRVRVDYLPM